MNTERIEFREVDAEPFEVLRREIQRAAIALLEDFDGPRIMIPISWLRLLGEP